MLSFSNPLTITELPKDTLSIEVEGVKIEYKHHTITSSNAMGIISQLTKLIEAKTKSEEK